VENYLLSSNYKALLFTPSQSTAELGFGGYSKLSFIVPAGLNGKTVTFSAWDPVAGAWVTTGQTQLLATGYFVPSAAQLAALAALPIVRLSIDTPVSASCELVAFVKT
jgi:hypothetical protein